MKNIILASGNEISKDMINSLVNKELQETTAYNKFKKNGTELQLHLNNIEMDSFIGFIDQVVNGDLYTFEDLHQIKRIVKTIIIKKLK